MVDGHFLDAEPMPQFEGCGQRLRSFAIRAIFNQEGELSAAIKLRRRFPGITDNAKARTFVRTIARWKPLPAPPCSVIQSAVRGAREWISIRREARDLGDRADQVTIRRQVARPGVPGSAAECGDRCAGCS
jgi:hypothetical protein